MTYAIVFIFIIIPAIVLALVFGLGGSSGGRGSRSEQAVTRLLDRDSRRKDAGRTLTNLYVPKASGGTAEIDVLYITSKGLFVIENKDYAGYIFGREVDKNWTVTLYAGKSLLGENIVEKYQFYNPVWQNRTHIKCLKAYLGYDIKTFSLITFSDRSELKSISLDSPDVFVCHHSRLFDMLTQIWDENPDVLTKTQIENLYDRLQPLANDDQEMWEQHVSNIYHRFNTAETCPVCGGQLVVRTAKKGPNAGGQFYGCSNYPKCTFTRNL